MPVKMQKNDEGKGENAGHKHFLLPLFFFVNKSRSLCHQKLEIVWLTASCSCQPVTVV